MCVATPYKIDTKSLAHSKMLANAKVYLTTWQYHITAFVIRNITVAVITCLWMRNNSILIQG